MPHNKHKLAHDKCIENIEKKEQIWPILKTNAPIQIENFKKQSDNTKLPPKASITQRLRTDLEWSILVTTAYQLVWLNRLTGSQRFHLPRKLCYQKDRFTSL